MFYDIFLSLCQRDGKKPSVVAAELGINKSNVSNWKNSGYTPRGTVLQRVAGYFGVSVDYLLGKTSQNKKPAAESDELMPVYLSLAKNMQADGIHPDDIRDMIEILKRRRNDKG